MPSLFFGDLVEGDGKDASRPRVRRQRPPNGFVPADEYRRPFKKIWPFRGSVSTSVSLDIDRDLNNVVPQRVLES